MNILESVKNLTKDNGAVKSLRDLLVLTNFVDESLEQFFTFVQNVQNGQKLGWTGEMEDVGWTGASCNPTYKDVTIQAAEKTWDIGQWSVPLKWCYEDFMNTIAEYALKTGTNIGDLTSTDIMDVIIYPALELSIKRMFWRFIWFGDKEAQNASTGQITEGVDVELFKPCNGFWKQLFAIGAANANQRVNIAANAEASTAAQLSGIKTANAAIGIFDSLLENADPRIAAMDGAAIYCTKSLGDALTKDLKREYKEILTWEQIFKGLDVTEYNGVMVYRVSIWDRFIQKYQNNGTKLNLPHRAIYGSPKQLFVGSPANQIISDLEIWFNQDERVTKAYSAGRLGCLVGEDNLFQIAY
ncbi:MAG: major capsid protein, P2 family protein [Bacteriophage sp.]|nr:MAG: major capsid protein, P2 family protein [Bacteriophage sp.]